MFAYCNNEPVLSKDSSGQYVADALHEQYPMGGGGAIAGAGLFGALYELAKGASHAIAGLVHDAVDAISATAEEVAEMVKEKLAVVETIDPSKRRDQNVYIMRYNCGPNVGKVGYIGRTNDPVRRQGEHNLDPNKQCFSTLVVVATGLTKEQAITLEQALISAYTINGLANKRREIGIARLPKFEDYSDILFQALELEASFAESEWLSYYER